MPSSTKRSTLVLVLAGVAAWGVGCGGVDMIEIPPPNSEPIVTSTIPPYTIAVGDYVNIGLSSHFSDPDGGVLTYEASSSNPAVARVLVTGTLLTVEALSRGIADVTVTARDDQAAEVRQVVEVLSCVAIPEDALHWWTGDGTGADIVGGLDVTLMNGAAYATGHVDSNAGEPFSFGEAFSFDGLDAIGHLPDAPTLNPTGPFSVMAWARPRPASVHSGAIIGKGHPWAESWVLDTHNGVWRTFIRDRNLRDTRIHGPSLVENEWTHLAMSWDGDRLAFYVDARWSRGPAASEVST